MYARVLSCSLKGIESEVTVVEADLSNAIPAFHIVGLPDVEVKESKERVRSAIINTGYKFPSKRITINLSPAHTKKEGTHYDLPMAIGILIALEQLHVNDIQEYALIGELSLNGKINRINGVIPLILGLRNKGICKIILPYGNAEEASIIDDIEIYPFNHLKEV
ncbi:MAG: ATP-binding protein, partial [Clostridiales bacterium]|nr:ATP-binding protein [Clostridiales bacterium]